MRLFRHKPIVLPHELSGAFHNVDEALNADVEGILALPIEKQMALSDFYEHVLKNGSRKQKEKAAEIKALHPAQYKSVLPAVKEAAIGMVRKLRSSDGEIELHGAGRLDEYSVSGLDSDEYLKSMPSFEQRIRPLPVRRMRQQKEQWKHLIFIDFFDVEGDKMAEKILEGERLLDEAHTLLLPREMSYVQKEKAEMLEIAKKMQKKGCWNKAEGAGCTEDVPQDAIKIIKEHPKKIFCIQKQLLTYC